MIGRLVLALLYLLTVYDSNLNDNNDSVDF